MARFKLPFRIWILIIFLFLSILAINPTPGATGVQIKNVNPGIWVEQGLATGQIVTSLNDMPIESVLDFNQKLESLRLQEQNILVIVDGKEYNYTITDNIGFEVNENLTVTESTIAPFGVQVKLESINDQEIESLDDLNKILDELIPQQIIKIGTNVGEIGFLSREVPRISVGEAAKSNIKKGLDLEGGTRVLLKPISEERITDNEINDIIAVLENRLNIYGLTDLQIRSATDLENERYILIEIAGVTREEVQDLIDQQGVFEAKIGNETVFRGGREDIPFVCRNDGSCSGVRHCNPSGEGWNCRFEFVIHLSPQTARRHAEITRELDVILSDSGKEILSENIDFYLDGKLVDSLQIGADLKGSETTAIAISGPGYGSSRDIAIDNALDNMNKLQTILITGSLPYNLEVVKLDSISPVLGKSFIRNSILVGIIALLAVAGVIFIRYRSVKIMIPLFLTGVSEITILLGFAALVGWNLDMAAIAGIIATVGTGIDDQIIIIDEILNKKSSKFINWKQKIRNAFFIITAAYATTVAAMIPLWNAGAGLIRGFALTTIVGVSIGVFITRPAFAAISEKLLKK